MGHGQHPDLKMDMDVMIDYVIREFDCTSILTLTLHEANWPEMTQNDIKHWSYVSNYEIDDLVQDCSISKVSAK